MVTGKILKRFQSSLSRWWCAGLRNRSQKTTKTEGVLDAMTQYGIIAEPESRCQSGGDAEQQPRHGKCTGNNDHANNGEWTRSQRARKKLRRADTQTCMECLLVCKTCKDVSDSALSHTCSARGIRAPPQGGVLEGLRQSANSEKQTKNETKAKAERGDTCYAAFCYGLLGVNRRRTGH